MKRLLLLPSLAALALSTAAVHAVETSEPVITTVVSDKQNNFLFEIQALPENIENTFFLKDLTTKTISFLNTLAESNPEEVGGESLFKCQKALFSFRYFI